MQYGYALRRLASKAFPTISLNAQKQWVLDQVVNGLGILSNLKKNNNQINKLADDLKTIKS